MWHCATQQNRSDEDGDPYEVSPSTDSDHEDDEDVDEELLKNYVGEDSSITNQVLALKVDDFVVVKYDGGQYPGLIAALRESAEVEVSAMKRSSSNWKWPLPNDEIWYDRKDVLRKIKEPIKLSSRGIFTVDFH